MTFSSPPPPNAKDNEKCIIQIKNATKKTRARFEAYKAKGYYANAGKALEALLDLADRFNQ